jgi:hypothetical protein
MSDDAVLALARGATAAVLNEESTGEGTGRWTT